MNQGVQGYPGRVEGIQGIAGEVRNVILKANTATPITKLDVSFDDCLVASIDGRVRSIGAQALTADFAFSGPNGLDLGAGVAASWYYVWVIWNEWGAAVLLSLNNAAPLIPAGYTHKGLIGEVQYDGVTALRSFITYFAGMKRFECTSTGGLPAVDVYVTGTAANVFAHRLGVAPKLVQVKFVCNAADLNYVAGDEVDICGSTASGADAPFLHVYADATNVKVVAPTSITAANTPRFTDKNVPASRGPATAAKWNVKVIATT